MTLITNEEDVVKTTYCINLILIRRCILVGDPNQLPATVISQTATSFRYEQSLFQRLQNAGWQDERHSVWNRDHTYICSLIKVIPLSC